MSAFWKDKCYSCVVGVGVRVCFYKNLSVNRCIPYCFPYMRNAKQYHKRILIHKQNFWNRHASIRNLLCLWWSLVFLTFRITDEYEWCYYHRNSHTYLISPSRVASQSSCSLLSCSSKHETILLFYVILQIHYDLVIHLFWTRIKTWSRWWINLLIKHSDTLHTYWMLFPACLCVHQIRHTMHLYEHTHRHASHQTRNYVRCSKKLWSFPNLHVWHFKQYKDLEVCPTKHGVRV